MGIFWYYVQFARKILRLFSLYYRPQQSCGQGNIFPPVCHSVHGGGVSASVHAGIPHPPSRHPLGAGTPLEQTPPQNRHPSWELAPPWSSTPWEQTPPGADTPPEQTPPLREADSGIRSMSGRYASYWNAFLCYK